MLTKALKFSLTVFMVAMALALVLAMASLLLYAIGFAILALLAGIVFAPNDVKAIVDKLDGVIDGAFTRLEALWKDLKSTLDRWGDREMAQRGQSASSPKADMSAPTQTDESTKAQ